MIAQLNAQRQGVKRYPDLGDKVKIGVDLTGNKERALDLEERRTATLEQSEKDRVRLAEEGRKLQNKQFAVQTGLQEGLSPTAILSFLDNEEATSPDAAVKLIQKSDADDITKLMPAFKEKGMEGALEEAAKLGISNKSLSRLTAHLTNISEQEMRKATNERAEQSSKIQQAQEARAVEEANYENTLRPLRESNLRATETLTKARAEAIPDEKRLRELGIKSQEANIALGTKQLELDNRRLDIAEQKYKSELSGASPAVKKALETGDPSPLSKDDFERYDALIRNKYLREKDSMELTDTARDILKHSDLTGKVANEDRLRAIKRLPTAERKDRANEVAFLNTAIIEDAKKLVNSEGFDFTTAAGEIAKLKEVEDDRKYQASDVIFEKLKNKLYDDYTVAVVPGAWVAPDQKKFAQAYADLVKLQIDFGVKPYVPTLNRLGDFTNRGKVGTKKEAETLIKELSK